MDLSSFLNTALAIIAIATLAGLGLQRGDRTALKEQLAEAREEIRAIRESRAEEQKEHAAEQTRAHTTIAEMKSDYDTRIATMKAEADTKIATLTADLDALSRTVTARDELKVVGQNLIVMSEALTKHHTEAAAHWLKDEALWAQLVDWMETRDA